MNYEDQIYMLRQPLSYEGGYLIDTSRKEAADSIEVLLAENQELRDKAKVYLIRAEAAEKARIAAEKDLRGCAIESCSECIYCLYNTARSYCGDCTDGSNWKYRGPKED